MTKPNLRKIQEKMKEMRESGSKRKGPPTWKLPTRTGSKFKFRILCDKNGNISNTVSSYFNMPISKKETIKFLKSPEPFGGECPIKQVLFKYTNQLPKEDLKPFWPANQAAFNVYVKSGVHKDGDTPDPKTVYMFYASQTFEQSVYNQLMPDGEEGEPLDITDLESGMWYTASRKEDGKINFSIDPRPGAIHDDEEIIKHIDENRLDFSELFQPPSEEDMEKLNQVAMYLDSYLGDKVKQMEVDVQESFSSELDGENSDEIPF